MPANERDRLRALLDAVLEGTDDDAGGGPRRLNDMAGDAFNSPYHFSRLLSRTTGEPPVAMRRRVLLERAAWQLAHGAAVTEAAWDAGYESAASRGTIVLPWDGPKESIATVLEHQVFTKEIWLAAIDGHDTPPRDDTPDASRLLERHDEVDDGDPIMWLRAQRGGTA